MFPLSAQQQIIWLQQQLNPDNRAYHATAVIDLHGKVNSAVLRQCVTDAVGRHDAMRLRICDGDSAIACQEVAEHVDVDIPEHDLRSAEDLEERRLDLLHRTVHSEFDLSTPPLVRWMLVRLTDSHWQLFMIEHHLVHDGRSTVEFLTDVFEQYAADVTGGHFVADPAPTYQDYVAYTGSVEYRARVAADVEWWRDRLAGAEFCIDFPELGSPRADLFDYRGAQHRQILAADLVDMVRTASQTSGNTVFTSLLAVYAELCRRHSGQNDLVFGVPLANRPAAFERTVGMMVNVVPLRLSVDAGSPGSEVALDAMAAIVDAIDHESAPVQDIVKALKRSGKGLDNPLYNVMFGMHDGPCPTSGIPDLSIDMQLALSAESTKFDLSVVVMPEEARHGDGGEHGYELVWEYSTQLFGPQDVERLASEFELLLRAYAVDPFEPIGTLAPAAVTPLTGADRAEREDLPAVDEAEPADVTRSASAGGPVGSSDSLWLQAFRDILERDDIDDNTDFFNAGGYSLLVPTLLSHYESLSGWRPPTSLVFEFPSPLELEGASAARRESASGIQG
ncbi:condensation domain-containing protein [Streptomyces sp. NPDC094468]|uniref:condensation domain-containing protein n=1 Tax=Streptomyces sp. NPDC094468 TaxID=3366066 RepID=UPI0038128B15